jgi:DNA-binding FadR family transcriptional regulator
LLVEFHVVGEAAARMDDETLAAIDSLMAAQRRAGDDLTRFLICDREFHVTIYRACGNPLLADFVTDLYAYMIGHRRKAMSEPGAIPESYADHQEIVRALVARDRDAVVAGFRSHLTRIYDTTKAMQDQLKRAASHEADRGPAVAIRGARPATGDERGS